MRFVRNFLQKTPSHIITAVAAVTLIGGISGASASGHGNNEQPPAPPTPAPAVVDPSMDPAGIGNTVCASAPSSKAKFKVFQNIYTDFSFTGANDRLRIGNTYQSWSNAPMPSSKQTIDVEGRTRNTKVTEIQVCVVTVTSTMTGQVDPTYGFPIYETKVIDAKWQSLYSDKSGKHEVHAAVPQFSFTSDPSGTSYTSTYMASAFFGGRGPGTSVSTVFGGGCCFGK